MIRWKIFLVYECQFKQKISGFDGIQVGYPGLNLSLMQKGMVNVRYQFS
jgi:hypothetical protein